MKRASTSIIAALCIIVAACPAGKQAGRSLDIYFLDMVGGASTLIVTPLGESVLIDTGSLEPKHRDADRIIRACRYAGLKQIDYLITTHFDVDHYGAIYQIHYNTQYGDEGNTAAEFIANGKDRGKGELIKASVHPEKGIFTVSVGVDGPKRSFPIRGILLM